jgi:DNA adenine methylase
MTYVEPFVGAGSVFYYKNPSKKEVINDLNSYVIRMHKGLQKYDGDKISKDFNAAKSMTKEEYDRLRDMKAPKDPYKNFIRELLLLKIGFFAKTEGQSYNAGKGDHLHMNLDGKYTERLKDTIILNEDFKNVVKKYDSPTTFFYLDPPYEESEGLYKDDMLPIKDVYDIMKNIKGKFMISYNNSKEAKKLFERFHIRYINTSYTDPFLGGQSRKVKEMIITNY